MTIAAKAPNPAIIGPPPLICSPALVDTAFPPLLVAVPLPAPLVVLTPTRLVLVTVLSAPPPAFVVAFVPAAEVVPFPLELPPEVVVFVAAVTLNEFPISTFNPALSTTLTALKFCLVMPNFANVLNVLEFPVVLSRSWV